MLGAKFIRTFRNIDFMGSLLLENKAKRLQRRKFREVPSFANDSSEYNRNEAGSRAFFCLEHVEQLGRRINDDERRWGLL